MDISEMTTEQLTVEDASLSAGFVDGGVRSLTRRHFEVKAELGRRTNIARTATHRSQAARKAAVTRAARKAAGLGPRRKEFSLDNAPTGGWSGADRVS
ncbi:MAG: hypothetical protein ACREQ5_00270 [Candidatus Dormibacteria bacterium]